MFQRPVTPLICALLTGLLPRPAAGQADSAWRSWNQPFAPFRIIDSIHYVGAVGVSSYLITSDEGHVLIDGGFKETAPQILANIRRLGYDPSEVRFLLYSHAHHDHAGGLAALREATGAALLASPGDADLLRRGGIGDFAFGDESRFPPVSPDRLLQDGETVELGGLRLTARFTPGHTKGCTTWTMQVREGGRSLDVLFHCSTSTPGYRLIANAGYPGIVEDYRRTFRRLAGLPCDVLLAPHGWAFDLAAKTARLDAETGSNPFVDPPGCRGRLNSWEADFEEELRRQRAEVSPPVP